MGRGSSPSVHNNDSSNNNNNDDGSMVTQMSWFRLLAAVGSVHSLKIEQKQGLWHFGIWAWISDKKVSGFCPNIGLLHTHWRCGNRQKCNTCFLLTCCFFGLLGLLYSRGRCCPDCGWFAWLSGQSGCDQNWEPPQTICTCFDVWSTTHGGKVGKNNTF